MLVIFFTRLKFSPSPPKKVIKSLDVLGEPIVIKQVRCFKVRTVLHILFILYYNFSCVTYLQFGRYNIFLFSSLAGIIEYFLIFKKIGLHLFFLGLLKLNRTNMLNKISKYGKSKCKVKFIDSQMATCFVCNGLW